MGISLEAVRNQIMTSIYGRRLGLDKDQCLTGPLAPRTPVTDFTSASTGTALPAAGRALIQATTASTATFILSNPIIGASVEIMQIQGSATNASSGTMLKRGSTAFYIESTEGSTMTTVNLSSRGSVVLTGVSSDRYVVSSRTESTANVNLNGTT